jgi:hypothetical protein
MAKAKRNISNKRPMTASLPQKKDNSKLVFLGAVTFVFILLIALFLMSGNDVPETQTTQTGSTETIELSDSGEQEQDLLGMAISGFVENDDSNPGVPQVNQAFPKYAVLNPKDATAYIDSANNAGNPFKIQVEASPYSNIVGDLPSSIAKVNHFEITITYPTSSFEFVTANIYSDPGTDMAGGWDTTLNDDFGVITFEGQGKDAASTFPYGEAVILAELTFKPKKNVGSDDITLADIYMMNSLDNGGEAVIISSDPVNDKITVNFNSKVYEDNDGDGYGKGGFAFTPGNIPLPGYVANNQDCNDDTTNDPVYDNFNCPNTIAGCVYGDPNQMDENDPGFIPNSYFSPECAICQNPSVNANEVCDGIDNDCNGQVDDGSGAPPSCLDTGYNCGVFYSCKGQQLLDCNNEQYGDVLKLDGHDRCALEFQDTVFCDVAIGQCVGDLSDCSVLQEELTQCQADLGVCEGSLLDCFNNNPNCDDVECTTLGGQCTSNGDCLVEGGTGCTVAGNTLIFDDSFGNQNMFPIMGCTVTGDNNYHAQYSCPGDGSTLLIDKTLCQAGCDDEDGCLTSVASPFEPILELTPACGIDGDGDGNDCDPFENCKTCRLDCGDCPAGAIDSDEDGVPNDQELTIATITLLGYGTILNGQDCLNNPDCDGDGVEDGYDFCPNTDTKDGQVTVYSGRINGYGCYAADVGTGKIQSAVRPDGCFSAWDTTYYIGYYTNLIAQESCSNVFGNPVVK